MPLIPTSAFVSGLHTAAANSGEIGFPDTIVVRGYLGPPSEDLERANQILGANGILDANGNPLTIGAADIDAVRVNPSSASPWRLYLSARGDCWIEIPNWERCVAYSVNETSTDRVGAFTVWLRTLDAGQPVRYRVVTVDEIDPDRDKFVSGRLVHDYMSHGASTNVVWDEQQFGPTTGKISTKYCF